MGQELGALRRIDVLATSSDHGTARAAAIDQARRYRGIGDDARAGQYSALADDIDRLRDAQRAERMARATAATGDDDAARAALERARAEYNSHLGLMRTGAPLAPDQHGPRLPGAAGVARETLDRRWQHLGDGHEALIQASGSDTPTPTVLGKTRSARRSRSRGSRRPRPGEPRDGL